MKTTKLHKTRIAVSIPYYNASKHICDVVSKLPDFIDMVIVTDDKSPEPMDQAAIKSAIKPDTEIVFLGNQTNLGVGGAAMKGFQYAIDHGFDIVVKIDSDDQMDAKYLPDLLQPLLKGRAEMAKGNRFRDLNALKKMPVIRRSGNLILSFMTKAATGYWNNFDPNNGYLAIKTATLRQVDFSKLSNRYFFETSLIAQLYFLNARIKDVAMPAIYADEKSSMKVWRMPVIFATSLMKVFVKRIAKAYFLYDFNIASIYLFTGLPLFLFGAVYGIYNWIYYSSLHILAPTGTIMLVTLSVILGFQLLLQAIQYDIIHSPKAR